MDIGKAFSYQFEDKQWMNKLGLGAIVSIVPILNFAWTGYMVEILRNIANGVEEPLPTWDDLGKKFNEGIILFAAGLVYALPILLVACLPMGVVAFSSIFSGNGDLQDIGQAIASAGGALFYCLLCVFFLYSIVLSVIYPAILVIYSREGTFASCFQFREAIDMVTQNMASFFTAWGISLAAGIGVGLVGGMITAILGWIPCIGWIVSLAVTMASTVYIATVYSHLFGQFGASTVKQIQPA